MLVLLLTASGRKKVFHPHNIDPIVYAEMIDSFDRQNTEPNICANPYPLSPHLVTLVGWALPKVTIHVSFSARPAIFLGNSTESRFSLTGEKEISPGWTPFVGAGVATNTDQNGETNLMLSGGVDVQVGEKLVLNIGGNWIFQSEDNDREINVTVNYLF